VADGVPDALGEAEAGGRVPVGDGVPDEITP
jgi:hypothetical protein